MELLKVNGLQKKYGEKTILDGINFSLNEGDVLGFLGPNGAGKSTTIRILTGIETADGGVIHFDGKPITNHSVRIKKQMGVVPQDIAIYSDMPAYDNVKFFCSLYGYRGAEREKRVQEALEFVALWDRRKDRPHEFSGGMKRRLNIACSITHSPKLLIMDEPTVGIDPQSRNYIMQAIKTLNSQGSTVIYVSHYMEEIETLCNRILIMDHGKILEDREKQDLMSTYKDRPNCNLEEIFLSLTGTKLRDEEA